MQQRVKCPCKVCTKFHFRIQVSEDSSKSSPIFQANTSPPPQVAGGGSRCTELYATTLHICTKLHLAIKVELSAARTQTRGASLRMISGGSFSLSSSLYIIWYKLMSAKPFKIIYKHGNYFKQILF